jgi:FAD dependent oxidoreductase TIGR03364
MPEKVDVAVVGAGIMGLAHAWSAARQGLSVAVFERTARAEGASVRNFGMVWPIGQPGEMYHLAMRSRARWLEAAEKSGLWLSRCGSLHLAYYPDEWAVLQEFVGAASDYDCKLLTPAETCALSPSVNPDGLLGALYSPTECCVDPRQAIATLPGMLEGLGVRFHFRSPVRHVEEGRLHTADGSTYPAETILVCSGSDFENLLPEAFTGSGIRRCKLQMMRTQPQPGGWRLGAHLAGGLTLCHYASFQSCPSLSALRERFRHEMPDYVKYGIHVMASQNHLGEVVIGDSHEYEDDIEPFDKAHIDELILAYLGQMVRLPDARIAARWNGVYAKHPTLPAYTARPMKGVAVRVAPGGAGMTMSFGLADRWFESGG